MKKTYINKSIVSFVTIFNLGIIGCSNGGSTYSDTSMTEVENQNPVEKKKIQTQEILTGSIDLTNSATKKSLTRNIAKADTLKKFNCGTNATIQLYSIDDIGYKTALLKESIEVNQTNCAFSINDTDFIDENISSSDNQYLIRTLIQENGKTVELSAVKLSTEIEVGVIDPIATLIKERFSVVITEVKTSMKKLESLGVTADSLKTAIFHIIEDFEKNFDTTVENLKKDIASGKIDINLKMFETTETFDNNVTQEQLLKREEKENFVIKKFENSSVSNTFKMLESSMKKEQLNSITISKADLQGELSNALAEIKYGIIESFVKIGLPVHDGKGNLIIYIPLDETRKSELPGKIYKLSEVGDDFTIRVIDPKNDLKSLQGNEDWYKDYIEYSKTIIPSNVIDAMIIAKEHTITMEELGKTLSKIDDKNATTDIFTSTGVYNTVMDDSIETSVTNIVNVFKSDLIKESFSQMIWEDTNKIFISFDGTNIKETKEKILALPFIVKDDESATDFTARISENSDSMGFIVEELGASLANGIPSSDSDKSILQFSSGTKIEPSSKMKPLASLAMINLFMQVKGEASLGVFQKEPLTKMFGWLLEDTQDKTFDDFDIWLLNFENSSATEIKKAPSAISKEYQFDAEDEAQKSTDTILSLMKTITGNSEIIVENSFNTMITEFLSSINKIEQKSVEQFNFEDKFKGNMIDFDGAETTKASISFELKDFNNSIVLLDENETLILYPIFIDKESYEKEILDIKTVLSLKENGRYEASDFNIYNPKQSFNTLGKADINANYVTSNDFDLILLQQDGTQISIATFPIFKGDNNLTMPFYYDSFIKNETDNEIITDINSTVETSSKEKESKIDNEFENIVDNNHNETEQQSIQVDVHGKIQKGAYLTGTTLTIYELDKELYQTGNSYATTIKNDQGEYDFKGVLQTSIVEMFANGYFYDELRGENSQSTLQLSALVDLKENSTVNLNLLSSLMKPRVQKLMEDGQTYREAKNQSQQEVLKLFHIEDNNVSFATLDLSANNEGAKILLATTLSLIMATSQSSIDIPTLSEFIADLKYDLTDNGLIDDMELQEKLKYGMQNIDIQRIKKNLKEKNGYSTIPFEEYLDTDFDGLINKYDDNTINFEQNISTIEFHIGDIVSLPTITISGLKENSPTDLLIRESDFKNDDITIIKNNHQITDPKIITRAIPLPNFYSRDFVAIPIQNDDNISITMPIGFHNKSGKVLFGDTLLEYDIPKVSQTINEIEYTPQWIEKDYTPVGIESDENACTIENGYNVSSDNSLDASITKDETNGIEIASKYRYNIDSEISKVSIFYPNLTQELKHHNIDVSYENYKFSFDESWLNNSEKTIYIQLPTKNKSYSCYRFNLNALTDGTVVHINSTSTASGLTPPPAFPEQ